MKKFIILFSLILIAPAACHAYIDSQFMKTEQYLVNTGYSAEAAKMTRITSEDPYRQPYVEGKSGKEIMRRIYHYIGPNQENDLDFYNHSGHFNGTSWKDY